MKGYDRKADPVRRVPKIKHRSRTVREKERLEEIELVEGTREAEAKAVPEEKPVKVKVVHPTKEKFLRWMHDVAKPSESLRAQRQNMAERQRRTGNVGALPEIEWSEQDAKGRMVGYGSDGNLYKAYPTRYHVGYGVFRVLKPGNVFYMGVYDLK